MTNEVRISFDAQGEEWHHAAIDAEHIVDHPHIGIVHAAVQQVLGSMSAPGVRASIGVLRKDVDEKRAAGVDVAELAEHVQQAALAEWANAALRAGRLDVKVGDVETPEGPVTAVNVNGVVFTDEKFGVFLVAVEMAVLHAIDAITESALAADRAARA